MVSVSVQCINPAIQNGVGVNVVALVYWTDQYDISTIERINTSKMQSEKGTPMPMFELRAGDMHVCALQHSLDVLDVLNEGF